MNLNLDSSYQKSAKLLNFENKLSSFPSLILLDQDNLSLNLTNSNKHRKDIIYYI